MEDMSSMVRGMGEDMEWRTKNRWLMGMGGMRD
jgi:hypothetical protein